MLKLSQTRSRREVLGHVRIIGVSARPVLVPGPCGVLVGDDDSSRLEGTQDPSPVTKVSSPMSGIEGSATRLIEFTMNGVVVPGK